MKGWKTQLIVSADLFLGNPVVVLFCFSFISEGFLVWSFWWCVIRKQKHIGAFFANMLCRQHPEAVYSIFPRWDDRYRDWQDELEDLMSFSLSLSLSPSLSSVQLLLHTFKEERERTHLSLWPKFCKCCCDYK